MVRSDKNMEKSFAESKEWDTDKLTGSSGSQIERYALPMGEKARISFSGSERNSVFVKSTEGTFVDISGNSGMDLDSDCRTVGVLDLDRDGFNDFLLTSCNQETLSVFHNRIGTLNENAEVENNFVAIRVVGGNDSWQTSSEYSSRDGIGALIRIESESHRQIREVRSGEGFCTQNSLTCLVGIGKDEIAKSIEVNWPSGKSSVVEDVSAGMLVEIYENPEQAVGSKGFLVKPYRKVEPDWSPMAKKSLPFPVELDSQPKGKLTVVVAMATWCDACLRHLDDLSMIREQLPEVEIIAIPIDAKETAKKLSGYMEKHDPAYRLLSPNETRGQKFVEFVVGQNGSAETPFAVVINDQGEVLQTTVKTVPVISELKRLIASPTGTSSR